MLYKGLFIILVENDYLPIDVIISFTGTQNHTINVTIVDDQDSDADEAFFAELELLGEHQNVKLKNSRITVTIIDDGKYTG